MRLFLGILPLALLLTAFGCASMSGYDRYYVPESNETFPPLQTKDVKVRTVRNYDALRAAAEHSIRNGTILLGTSAWEGPRLNPNQAKQKAASIGANVVYVAIDYSHTLAGAVSMPRYNPGRSSSANTDYSGTIYGVGNISNFRGTANTTTYTPGYTSYQVIPYSVARYDHSAVYLREPSLIGRDTGISTRGPMQRNAPSVTSGPERFLIENAKKIDVESADSLARLSAMIEKDATPEALFNMGAFHYTRAGSERNFVEAHKWINLATAIEPELQRRKIFAEVRDFVGEKLTKNELNEAQRMATDIYPTIRSRLP